MVSQDAKEMGRSFPSAGAGCDWLPPPGRANGSPAGRQVPRHKRSYALAPAARGPASGQRGAKELGGSAPLTWLRRGRVSLESFVGDRPPPARAVPPAESGIKSFARCRMGGEFAVGSDGATGSL